jgi:hypothetical protein
MLKMCSAPVEAHLEQSGGTLQCSTYQIPGGQQHVRLEMAGCKLEFTPDESRALSTLLQRFNAAFAHWPQRASSASKPRSECTRIKIQIQFQIHCICFFLWSTREAGVLSSRVTIGDLCFDHCSSSFAAAVGAIIVNDVRALRSSYRSILSVIPEYTNIKGVKPQGAASIVVKPVEDCTRTGDTPLPSAHPILEMPPLDASIKMTPNRSVQAGQEVFIRLNQVTIILVARYIADFTHYVALIGRPFSSEGPSKCKATSPQHRPSTQSSPLMLKLDVRNCCLLVPETGWSDRALVLTTPNILVAPNVGSKFFHDAKRLSCCKYASHPSGHDDVAH